MIVFEEEVERVDVSRYSIVSMSVELLDIDGEVVDADEVFEKVSILVKLDVNMFAVQSFLHEIGSNFFAEKGNTLLVRPLAWIDLKLVPCLGVYANSLSRNDQVAPDPWSIQKNPYCCIVKLSVAGFDIGLEPFQQAGVLDAVDKSFRCMCVSTNVAGLLQGADQILVLGLCCSPQFSASRKEVVWKIGKLAVPVDHCARCELLE